MPKLKHIFFLSVHAFMLISSSQYRSGYIKSHPESACQIFDTMTPCRLFFMSISVLSKEQSLGIERYDESFRWQFFHSTPLQIRIYFTSSLLFRKGHECKRKDYIISQCLPVYLAPGPFVLSDGWRNTIRAM